MNDYRLMGFTSDKESVKARRMEDGSWNIIIDGDYGISIVSGCLLLVDPTNSRFRFSNPIAMDDVIFTPIS